MFNLANYQYVGEIARADCSAEDAAKLLDITAGYLERGEVVPSVLADFIAKALRSTAKVDHEHRAMWLAAMLKLTAPNRRPKYTKLQLKIVMQSYAYDAAALKLSETKTIARIAKTLGISTTHARTQWNEWKTKNPNILANAERFSAYYDDHKDEG